VHRGSARGLLDLLHERRQCRADILELAEGPRLGQERRARFFQHCDHVFHLCRGLLQLQVLHHAVDGWWDDRGHHRRDVQQVRIGPAAIAGVQRTGRCLEQEEKGTGRVGPKKSQCQGTASHNIHTDRREARGG
jgi:hypothetical protein